MNFRKSLGFLLCATLLPSGVPAQELVEVMEAKLPFKVVSRKDQLEYFPCDACHEDMEANPTPRVLEEAPHFPELEHGAADIWCTTCHTLDNREYLHTFSGKLVSFDSAYIVCGQCHSAEYEDWQHAAHGKRLRRWRGGREVLNCTECHNPHLDPGIEPRRPKPPPGVRVRLQRQERVRHRGGHRWESHTQVNEEGADVSQ